MKDILNSKELNASKKQRTIEELIVCGKENTDSIISVAEELNDKHLAIVLSALESISRSHPDMVGQKGLDFAAKHIDSANNSVKREASRIVGNLCGFYSSIPDSAIRKLLDNTNNESTERSISEFQCFFLYSKGKGCFQTQSVVYLRQK